MKLSYGFKGGRRSVATIAVIGALVAGSSVGILVSVEIGGASSVPAGLGPNAVYPTNAHGQSYGSSLGATSQTGEPDLILVVATNGKTGYVSKSEMNAADGGNVTTPQQAIAWTESGANASHSIPVYAEDGSTVIGSFVVGPAAAHP